jgi:hypothetical protein
VTLYPALKHPARAGRHKTPPHWRSVPIVGTLCRRLVVRGATDKLLVGASLFLDLF